MVDLGYPSVDWSDGWSLTGGLTTIDLIAATAGALNGALAGPADSPMRSTVPSTLTGTRTRAKPCARALRLNHG